MRLFTHIKAFGEAARRQSTDTKPRLQPSGHRQPLSNITHEEFVMSTPSDGVIAKRRSSKETTATAGGADTVENHPSLHADPMERTPDASPSAALFTFSMTSQTQQNPDFPAEEAPTHRKKRKRELDSIVRRVKSVRLSVNTKMLMDLSDDYENDMRRFQIRAPALEVEPLRDSLSVATSADAMQRYGTVIQARRDSLALGAL